jgi:quercetin dioxygenase-like cupin family protein
VRHRHARDTVVVWTEGRAGHATFLPAGIVHASEAIGAAAKATIFELK